MKQIETISEIQKISLKGLQTFDFFCRKHNLKYSLAAGSMIGAVRHQGFIPWDDDIDLYMLREEYERLISLIKEGEQFEDTEFEVYIPERENYIYPFIKIVHKKTIVYEKNVNRDYAIGIWIDIFPIDYCGNSLEEAGKIWDEMEKSTVGIMRSVAKYDDSTIISAMKNVYVWFYRNVFRNNYKKYVQQKLNYHFPAQKGLYMGQLVWPFIHGKKLCDVYPAECFEDYEEISFEGKNYMIFSGYREILRQRYGMYMQLPPKEQQVGHDFCAFYRA